MNAAFATEGQPGRTLVLYHQTSEQYATKILEAQQMRRGLGGSLGGAIYFAEDPTHTNCKAQSRGVILQASVKAGKSLVLTSKDVLKAYTHTELKKMGCDSILAKFFSTGPEYVVYNWGQVNDIKIHSGPSGFNVPLKCPKGVSCYRKNCDHINEFHPPGFKSTIKQDNSSTNHCKYGASCYRTNPDHIREFHSAGYNSATKQNNSSTKHCKYGTSCYRKNPDHIREFH